MTYKSLQDWNDNTRAATLYNSQIYDSNNQYFRGLEEVKISLS